MPKTRPINLASAHAGAVHVGDVVETHSRSGQPARRGRIVEILGEGEHERYRVGWDEQHESILYPSDGVTITREHA